MLAALKSSCGTKFTMSRRETLIATGLMVGGSLAMVVASVVLRGAGYADTKEFILNLSFTIPMVISTHYMYLRKQPRRVQAAITGFLLFILVGASILATKI